LFLFNSKAVIFSYIFQDAEEWDVKTVVMPPFFYSCEVKFVLKEESEF
jgi:hypothetical protein